MRYSLCPCLRAVPNLSREATNFAKSQLFKCFNDSMLGHWPATGHLHQPALGLVALISNSKSSKWSSVRGPLHSSGVSGVEFFCVNNSLTHRRAETGSLKSTTSQDPRLVMKSILNCRSLRLHPRQVILARCWLLKLYSRKSPLSSK